MKILKCDEKNFLKDLYEFFVKMAILVDQLCEQDGAQGNGDGKLSLVNLS